MRLIEADIGPSAGPQFVEPPGAPDDIDELTPPLQGGPQLPPPELDHDAMLDADDD